MFIFSYMFLLVVSIVLGFYGTISLFDGTMTSNICYVLMVITMILGIRECFCDQKHSEAIKKLKRTL